MEGARSNEKTYLVWSIFNTFCCCFPLGVAAIIYSCRADTANALGDGTKARESSRTARNLNIAAVVIGIICLIIIIVYYMVPK
ncbi:putative interferon-induced transmembrane protein 1-like [Triplophysa rosa]|uniref:Interferon-induced transmembrane protein 1-like n=1 Tax=Triplophysa rosa TaxID=992332 RepID=A0A9W8CB26_TRIRA|nr:putative interferon-induced transmembrane protein 1-like [Triplophysa rosa]